MSERRVRVVVTGRVQGVYYRGSTQQEASRLGVAGWVRNRDDGSVEFVAAGPSGAVDALIAWAHRGPDGARVDGVAVTDDEGPAVAGGFEVRR
jgi:acylphosphatase